MKSTTTNKQLTVILSSLLFTYSIPEEAELHAVDVSMPIEEEEQEGYYEIYIYFRYLYWIYLFHFIKFQCYYNTSRVYQ